MMGPIKASFKASNTTWMNEQMVKIDQKLEEVNDESKSMQPNE
jgi:hypothetical protein